MTPVFPPQSSTFNNGDEAASSNVSKEGGREGGREEGGRNMIRLQFLSRCFSSGFIHFQRVINSGKSRGKFLPIRFASITALATVFEI
jgi:hypothetical protein